MRAIVVSVCLLLAAAEAADFMVVPSLRSYSVLDRYEQHLTEQSKAALGDYVPLQIEETNATLGDGITRALRFSLGASPFFLLRDEKGGFIGAGPAADRRTYRGSPVNDTVEVAADGAVQFVSARGRSGHLRKGELVHRVFRLEGRYYVNRLDEREYGWCPSHSALAPRKMAAQYVVSGELSPELRERIVSRFQSVNESYRALFGYFNTKTNEQKSVPVWTCSGEGSTIRCVLSAPYGRTGELDESTKLLVRDLEGILLGKPFSVNHTTGAVVIGPREARPPTVAQ